MNKTTTGAPWQAAYLAELKRTGSPMSAAAAAGVAHSTAWRRRAFDPSFAAAAEAAQLAAAPAWGKSYLKALRKHGKPTNAAREARVDLSTVRRRMLLDKSFARSVETTLERVKVRLAGGPESTLQKASERYAS